MKLPEANAAFGREQLKKLDGFSKRRIENYNFLKKALKPVQNYFVDIKIVNHAKPSWFGLILTFKDTRMNRNEFSEYLEASNIRTRPFFAGNITRHTPFKQYEKDYPVADKLMRDSLFIGVWQGLSNDDLLYMAGKIKEYVLSRKV
jgi:CDP-6-deoxy-D-xylo-4-hexulose-3-dehydrase